MANRIFNCVRCGFCCAEDKHNPEKKENNIKSDSKKGIVVYPEESDIIDMMTQIKQIPVEFKEESIILDIKNKRIIVTQFKFLFNEEGFCPFFKENRCLIYDQRPLFCRAYPLVLKQTESNKVDMNIEWDCQSLKNSNLKIGGPENIDTPTIPPVNLPQYNSLDDIKKYFPMEFRAINQILLKERQITKKLNDMIQSGEFDPKFNVDFSFEEFQEANADWERYILYTEHE